MPQILRILHLIAMIAWSKNESLLHYVKLQYSHKDMNRSQTVYTYIMNTWLNSVLTLTKSFDEIDIYELELYLPLLS